MSGILHRKGAGLLARSPKDEWRGSRQPHRRGRHHEAAVPCGREHTQTTHAIIKGFKIMRMIRRGHCIVREPGAAGEVRFVNKLSGLPA